MFTLTISVIVITVVVIGLSLLSKTSWWERHICSNFDKSGYPNICFVCNLDNDACYTNRCPIMIEAQIKDRM